MGHNKTSGDLGLKEPHLSLDTTPETLTAGQKLLFALLWETRTSCGNTVDCCNQQDGQNA